MLTHSHFLDGERPNVTYAEAPFHNHFYQSDRRLQPGHFPVSDLRGAFPMMENGSGTSGGCKPGRNNSRNDAFPDGRFNGDSANSYGDVAGISMLSSLG